MRKEWMLSLGLMATAACESALVNPIGDLDKCPPRVDEVSPTDCALIEGSVRSPAGVPRQGFPVRVDSAVAAGYYYLSDVALTDEDGRFSLTVYRIKRIEPPADPDTARVEIKTYASSNPEPGSPATASVRVLMHFAELGRSVRVTFADLTF